MSPCTHFLLLTSAVVSEKGSLSSTDASVRGGTGGSGQGVKPGASNGEFPVCCEQQVVLAMGKRPGGNGREQLLVMGAWCPMSLLSSVLAVGKTVQLL